MATTTNNLPAVASPAAGAPVQWLTPAVRLLLLALLAVAAIVLFMTLGAKGSWDFVLPFRGRKVLAMILVGVAIAVSTVVFQTITANRILTPSIMGFDALFMLIQTVAVYTIGGAGLIQLDPRWRFAAEVLAMTLFAGTLYWWLFVQSRRGLHFLLLVGIIFGVLFRSISSFLQRLIEPNEFAVLQDAAFASFNAVDETLLAVAAVLMLAMLVIVWRLLPPLDVLALGRELAINLGVPYRSTVTLLLLVVTILVATATALVGPITFFGLLVANLAYLLAGGASHRLTLPTASLLAIICLVGGQLVLEKALGFNGSLSIVIDFAGGIVFILLLVRGKFR